MAVVTGTTAASLTCDRVGDAWIETGTGWSLVPANTPRISDRGWLLIEEGRTNSVRNSACAGASPGNPGLLPTNATSSPSPTVGLSRQVVGSGVENGIDYVDVRWFGTSTGGDLIFYAPEGTQGIVAMVNQIWAHSCFVKRTAGTLTNVSSVILRADEHDFLGVSLGNVLGFDFKGGIQTGRLMDGRVSMTRTNSTNVQIGFVSFSIVATCDPGPVDMTLRFGWPQSELCSTLAANSGFATTPIRTAGAAVARASDVISWPYGSWFNPDVGTFYVEVAVDSPMTNLTTIFSLTDGSGLTQRIMLSLVNSARHQFTVTTNNATQAGLLAMYAYAPWDFQKLSATYMANDFCSYFTGDARQYDYFGAVAQNTTVPRFAGHDAKVYGCFRVRRLMYWPNRLVGATQQAMVKV